MAGWLFKGVCFAQQQHAIDTHFQSIQPDFEIASAQRSVFHPVKDLNGQWFFNNYTIDNLGNITKIYSIVAPVPNFSTCQTPDDHTTQFLNGMELGWAVSGVMLIVFLIRRTYRGF